MVVIKDIAMAGGACPYQIEATTEDGKYFYLRYRNGWLKAGVANNEREFAFTVESFNVIREKVGADLDGYPDHELFMEKLKDKVKFPDGFKFEYHTL